jgi:hypothetical protein
MPLDLQIIRASEFVRVGPSEQLDFAASKQALRLLAAACRKRGIHHAVLDLRSLPTPSKPIFTRVQLTELVETFQEAGFQRKQRLAILYRDDKHHGVRKFAFIGVLHGWQVRAFSDFERALLWLSSDDEPVEGARDEQEVPVRVVSRRVQVKSKPAPRATSAKGAVF